MISPESIERVREAADIVEIIGEHVKLKRSGSDFRGPCPFHQGNGPNFSVSARKNMYYCFVCHEHGDVFTFLQKQLGMEWPDAVRTVAQRVGIELVETTQRREGPDPREPLWEANEAAAEFFTRMLWDDAAGKPARDYLAGRGIARELADRFRMGWSPRDPAALRAHLTSQGYDEERLVTAGILVRREESGEVVPRFRGRLMLPILDAASHPVGFGGRIIGEGEPKYLNSAESPVFSKGRLLYNLHSARHAIRKEDRVLVVEGYFDVIRLVAAGIEWVVAPLGTALTEDQARLLRKLTRNAFLLYDSDRAGLKATFRAGDEMLRHQFAVQVVTLPNGEDPDTFVAQHGGERLLQHVSGALDVFERKVQILQRGGWFADLQRKRRALDRLLPTIRATADSLTRDIYVTRASEAAGVSKELLQREVDAAQPAPAAPSAPVSRAEAARERSSDRRRGDRRRLPERVESAERELLRVMLHHREEVEPLAERLSATDFRGPAYRLIFQALLRLGAEASVEEVYATLDDEGAAVMRSLVEEGPAVVDVGRTISDSLRALECRRINERLAAIDGLTRLAPSDEKDALLAEKHRLQQQRRDIGCPGRVGKPVAGGG